MDHTPEKSSNIRIFLFQKSALAFFGFMAACLFATTDAEAFVCKWIRLNSEHFEMFSSIPERESRDMLVQLEQFRAAVSQTFFKSDTYEKKTRMFVFATRSQYQPYAQLYKGEPKALRGVFIPGPFESQVAYVYETFGYDLSTIFHEYVHALVAAHGLTPPTFFNEGLAMAYATFSASGDKVTLGKPDQESVAVLAHMNSLISLTTLCRVTKSSPYYNEADKYPYFYAESWLVMHYLIFGKKSESITSEGMSKFVDLLKDPKMSVNTAFKRALGLSAQEVHDMLDEYRKKAHFMTKTLTIPAKPFRDKITSCPATEEECDIELTNLQWKSRNDESCVAKMRLLADQNPANPRPYEILAAMALKARQTDMETDYLRKAVANSTQNPLVYVWLLRQLYDKSNLPFDYIMPDDTCAEYRGYVDRALELAPNCLEALEMLAHVESQARDMRLEKINLIPPAIGGMGDDLKAKALLSLGIVYYRLKDYKSAEMVLKRFDSMPKPQAAEKATADELRRRITYAAGKASVVRIAEGSNPSYAIKPTEPTQTQTKP